MEKNFRKNSIKSLIALFVMSLVAVFVFPVFAPANTVVNAATTTSKEVVEWTAGNPTGQNIVDNGNNTISIVNTYDAVQQIKGEGYNPYKNIIKKTIIITDLVSPGGGRHGVCINLYDSGTYGKSSANAWTNPRVNIFDTCIQINNAWGSGSTQGNTDNRFKYSYNGSAYTLQENVPYTIYFGIENVYKGSVLYLEIYAKVTDVTGQITYVEQTHTVKAFNNFPAEIEETAYVRVRTGAKAWTETNDPYIVKEYDTSPAETYAMDALVHDEDISYFWSWDKKIANNLGKSQRNIDDIVVDKGLTLTKGDYFYTPDFDNRFTFKLSVDNYNEYFTTGGGQVKISLGQRYSATYFGLNYKTNKVSIAASKSTLQPASTSVSFDLDEKKDYKVSIALRDVRNSDGEIIYRLATIDVVDMTDSTKSVSVKLLTNDLIEYTPNDTSTLETHFRVDDIDYGTTSTYQMKCKLSSLERKNWDRSYFLTVEGGQKTALAELVYGDAYDFTNYVDEKAGYQIKGLATTIDGIDMEVPLSGKWNVDIFKQTNGVYSATLVPVYEEIEYNLTYNISGGANVVSGAPSKIAMSEVLDLPELENIPSGYVLIGWYADSAYTQKIDEITCEGGNVTIYAKVVEGYTFTLELPNGNKQIPVEKDAEFNLNSVSVEGYLFIGWYYFNGTGYLTQNNLVVSATKDMTFKPNYAVRNYEIKYNLNGGTNSAENKEIYTIEDEFTLGTPEKAGYFFVKFVDNEGKQVDKIAKGTTGKIELTAIFVKDEFKQNENLFVSTNAQEVPNFVIPETAYYTVAVYFDNQPITVEDGKAIFNQLGEYSVVYTITLNGGKTIEKTVTITATKLTLTLNGSYKAQYELNEKLVLLDASCQKETALVNVKVTKGGKEVEYKNFGLTLNELGVYTVTYTVQGEVADELIVTFEVVQGNVGNQTPKATTASIVDGGSGAGLLIACVGCVVGKHCGKSRARNLYKKKKEKGEN